MNVCGSRKVSQVTDARTGGPACPNEECNVTELIIKRRQGFASMDPEKLRQISQKGGHTAQQRGSAHRWTAEEARRAGRKGGRARRHRREADVEITQLITLDDASTDRETSVAAVEVRQDHLWPREPRMFPVLNRNRAATENAAPEDTSTFTEATARKEVQSCPSTGARGTPSLVEG